MFRIRYTLYIYRTILSIEDFEKKKKIRYSSMGNIFQLKSDGRIFFFFKEESSVVFCRIFSFVDRKIPLLFFLHHRKYERGLIIFSS